MSPDSHRPPWNQVPAWAEWLACDKNGSWYAYAEKPYKYDAKIWANSDSTKYEWLPDFDGSPWSHDHWVESLVQRPPKINIPSQHKRVTLFVDFDEEVSDDPELARRVGVILLHALDKNGDSDSVMHMPPAATVDKIRIAVDQTKLAEVFWNGEDFEVSTYNPE